MAILSAENLAKSYKKRQVVSDVSLTVNSGEIVGLLGPNGAGKTTTFYMVVGLVNHDQGKIRIDEEKGILYAYRNNKKVEYQYIKK